MPSNLPPFHFDRTRICGLCQKCVDSNDESGVAHTFGLMAAEVVLDVVSEIHEGYQ